MTKEDFDKLAEGAKVWYAPTYFTFPMLGIVKTIDGVKGVWVNFYGDGQCHFAPQEGYGQKFCDNVGIFKGPGHNP